MLNWLRRLDDAVFSPPHRFEMILRLVVSELRLEFKDDAQRTTDKAINSAKTDVEEEKVPGTENPKG